MSPQPPRRIACTSPEQRQLFHSTLVELLEQCPKGQGLMAEYLSRKYGELKVSILASLHILVKSFVSALACSQNLLHGHLGQQVKFYFEAVY